MRLANGEGINSRGTRILRGSIILSIERETDRLESVRRLQRYVSEAWTGVKFYFDRETLPDITVPDDLRFCEAVSRAKSSPLLLKPEAVSCPGARYVFGWSRSSRKTIAAELIERWGLERSSADTVIDQVPIFDRPLRAIGLNTDEIPDLIISYCRPAAAMSFLKLYQTAFDGRNLTTSFSSVLSVCGNVSVGAYISGNVSLSFGCEDSREFAGIGRDRMVIGIPYPLIKGLTARSGWEPFGTQDQAPDLAEESGRPRARLSARWA
jgi:uncharacterized protein (DUF169 family)